MCYCSNLVQEWVYLFEFRDKLVPMNCQFSGAYLKAVTPAEKWLILGMISTTPLQRSDSYWTDLLSGWQTHEMWGRLELSHRTDIQNEDEKSCLATMCTEKIASSLFPIHICNSYKTVRNVLSVCFIWRSSLVVRYKQWGVRVYHNFMQQFYETILWNKNFPVVLDFKLSPSFESCLYSFGYFPGVWLWFADVSEHSICSIFKGWMWSMKYTSYPAFEDGTDRVFRNVGKP